MGGSNRISRACKSRSYPAKKSPYRAKTVAGPSASVGRGASILILPSPAHHHLYPSPKTSTTSPSSLVADHNERTLRSRHRKCSARRFDPALAPLVRSLPAPEFQWYVFSSTNTKKAPLAHAIARHGLRNARRCHLDGRSSFRWMFWSAMS